MQMTLLASVIILVSVFPLQQKTPESSERKTPVEVWCAGDDLFSQGLCQALFTAFESTPEFEWLDENKPGNLIITVPENVGWKKIGKRTKISYLVEFSTSDDRVFMTRKGSCWHKEYETCANQILKQARIAARNLPRKLQHNPTPRQCNLWEWRSYKEHVLRRRYRILTLLAETRNKRSKIVDTGSKAVRNLPKGDASFQLPAPGLTARGFHGLTCCGV